MGDLIKYLQINMQSLIYNIFICKWRKGLASF